MLSGTGYPSGENYPAGTDMELFFYPYAGTGNPTGNILRVRIRVRVSTTRQVHTRCHLEAAPWRSDHDTWPHDRPTAERIQSVGSVIRRPPGIE
jgi:hypothetical protein